MKTLQQYILEAKMTEKNVASPEKIYKYFNPPYKHENEHNFCVMVNQSILRILVPHKIVKNYLSNLDDVTNIDLEVYDKKKLIATLKLSEDMKCFEELYKLLADKNYEDIFDCKITYNEDMDKNIVGNIKFEVIRDKSKLKSAKDKDENLQRIRGKQISKDYENGRYNGD